MNRLGDLFGALFDLIKSGGEDEDETKETINSIYDETVGKCRTLIKLSPWLIKKFFGDLRPLIVTAYKFSIDLKGDEEIQALARENLLRKATIRKSNLDIYVAAGFTREEAMALLLQDIANIKAVVKEVNESSKRTQSSSQS